MVHQVENFENICIECYVWMMQDRYVLKVYKENTFDFLINILVTWLQEFFLNMNKKDSAQIHFYNKD